MSAAIDDYRWLVSDAAGPWLAVARDELLSAGGATTVILSRLRKHLSGPQAHLVVEQLELRRRAREKFAVADKMFFTHKGLEQATDEAIAAYKATRFPEGEEIVDLCCGIGGDLMSLAARGPVTGVENDPVIGSLAAANARPHGLEGAACGVLTEDAMKYSIAGRAWHCDPDRRVEGRRATRGELFQPPLTALEQLLAENPRAAIKLAPATEAPAAWSESAELEWLGSRGECRQQVAWFGDLAVHPGLRSATVVDAVGGARTVVGTPSELPRPASSLGRYLYEPHSALLAAKLTAVVCRQHGLAPLSAGTAYLTCDEIIDDPILDCFEIHDVLPFDRRQLKAYCREHHIGRLEIKKRGVEVDPARLRKEIVGDGDGDATVIISPIAGQVRAIVAKRFGIMTRAGST